VIFVSAGLAQLIGRQTTEVAMMRKVFSTADVHPRDAHDYWHEILCEKVTPHDCTTEHRTAFHAELHAGALADIGLVLYESSPMYCSNVRHVKRANPDEIMVVRQVAGVYVSEQDTREVIMKAGDIAVFDPRLSMVRKNLQGSRQLVLKVPRRELEARVGNTRGMIARAIKPSAAEHSLTSAFLAMLPALTDKLGRAAVNVVRDQTLDLVAVSLAKVMDGGRPRVSSARSLVLVSVRAAIEARLSDPALDAETVAAAAGVSVRYANAVLTENDTSIMRLIWARRLERCRQALEDPSQPHRTVSEIAYGWGFSDTTHFGRRFRAAYGLLPSDYRRRARSTGSTAIHR
jgi:AraC family transcriptional regulator, positive regulator of tynA and feaB